MKKRLLALALCLVLAVSLLPITAAAEEFTVNSVHVVGDFCDWGFSGSYSMQALGSGVYELTISNADRSDFFDDPNFKFAINKEWTHCFGGTFVGSGVATDAEYNGDIIQLSVPYNSANITLRLDLSKFDFSTEQGATFTITITDANHNFDTGWTSDESSHWHKCLDEGCTATSGKAPHFDNNKNHLCDDCGASVHTWSYEVSRAGDSLTATCNPGCTIGKVTVKLNAHSVTLPDSPFHATLQFEGGFKEVFHCSEIEYQYEDPTAGWNYVDPDTFTPKPGNYQAGVLISGLPGNGGAASRAVGNEDGAGQNGSVYLYVKYTAADPKVTAQTGDNRPIELMLASVVVFSALAAAAFILDNKRKYSR